MRPASQAACGLCLKLSCPEGPELARTGSPAQFPRVGGSSRLGECLSKHRVVHVHLLESSLPA